jgi:hypothetical protein
MKKKISKELLAAVRAELSRQGGIARTKKFTTEDFKRWGKMGGRPKKGGSK